MNTASMIHTGKDDSKSHQKDLAALPQQRAGLVELTEEEVRVVAGGTANLTRAQILQQAGTA